MKSSIGENIKALREKRGKWYFEVPFLASKKKARSPP